MRRDARLTPYPMAVALGAGDLGWLVLGKIRQGVATSSPPLTVLHRFHIFTPRMYGEQTLGQEGNNIGETRHA